MARVPKGISLSSWIRQLIRENKIYKFYKTIEWLQLRDKVLRDNHYECERCRQKSPAVYSRAVIVHHIKEVRIFPELALNKSNLMAVCFRCHEDLHNRFGHDELKETLNEERW